MFEAQAPAQPATIRPFSSLLTDVHSVVITSRQRKNQGPTAEELAERAYEEAQAKGRIDGYAAGKKEGYDVGLMQGHELGHMQAYAEFTAQNKELFERISTDLEHRVAQVNTEIPAWFERAEEDMTDLAMEIVRKILASELEMTRDHAKHIVREALSEVTHSQQVRVRLNPFDSVVVAQHRDQLIAASTNLRGIEFVDDPSIIGGCIVESDGGNVDARIDVRLELIDEDFAA